MPLPIANPNMYFYCTKSRLTLWALTLFITLLGCGRSFELASNPGTSNRSEREPSVPVQAVTLVEPIQEGAATLTEKEHQRVLDADSELGKRRNLRCREISLDATILEYVNAMNSIEFDGCSDEFKTAFAAHIRAWNTSIPFFQSFSEMRGEMHDLFEQIRTKGGDIPTQLKHIEETIWGTWGEVEEATTRNRVQPELATVTVVVIPDDGTVPDAEVDDEGGIHVSYFANDNVFYIKSSDDGKSFSKPIRINSESGFASGGMHRGPDIAIGKKGRIHVIWFNAAYQQQRPKTDWGVMYSRFDPDSGSFESSRNLNGKPSDNYSLAADGDGNVAVIWMAGGVYALLSDDGGNTFSSPADLKTDPCECCASRSAYTSAGDLSVLYRDKADNFRDTYVAVLARGEQEFVHTKISDTPWFITNCPMTAGFLTTDRLGLLATWETKAQIYFSRLDRHGRRVSPREVHVSEKGRYPVALRSSSGTSLIAWKRGTQLQWRRFDLNDVAIGTVDSRQGKSSDRPSGVVTRKGNFILFP